MDVALGALETEIRCVPEAGPCEGSWASGERASSFLGQQLKNEEIMFLK